MSSKPRKKSPIRTPALPAPAPARMPSVESGALAAYRDAASLAKQNLAALTALNTALSTGVERIGFELMGMTRGTLESGAATASALLDARSIADVAALNGDFARVSLDRLVAGAMRVSELVFTIASAAYEPFGAHFERAFAPPKRPLLA